MISRSCRSYFYHMASRNSRITIIVVVAILFLLWTRNYIRDSTQIVSQPMSTMSQIVKPYRGHQEVKDVDKDVFMLPGPRASSDLDDHGHHELPASWDSGRSRALTGEVPKNTGGFPNIEKDVSKLQILSKYPIFKEIFRNGGKPPETPLDLPLWEKGQDQAKESFRKLEVLKRLGDERSKVDMVIVEYIATSLKVEVHVLTNVEQDKSCWILITLANAGKAVIPYGHWEIYFHSIRPLQPKEFPYPKGHVIKDTALRLFHLTGTLYRLIAESEKFTGLSPGKEISLHLEAKYSLVSRSDFFPNWYVVAPKTKPQLIQSTVGDNVTFVDTFDSPEKWKRRLADKYDPYTPEVRFNLNLITRDIGRPGSYIIPTPVSVNFDATKRVVVDKKSWRVIHSEIFAVESAYLAEKLQMQVSALKMGSRYIHFIEEQILPLNKARTVKEAYSLSVDSGSEVITISAGGKAGAFYGAVTLFSLTNRTNPQGSWEIPAGEILDQPRFSYRGLHLDVARNFHPRDEILRLLDIMSGYKLNKLHLHLSDDEGWRIEIPGIPELTKIGSKRCHSDGKTKCLYPSLGSSPSESYPGSGYYSVDDYRAILKHAARLHVQVIPEIDSPGHGRAAIKSMEARYRDQMSQGHSMEAQQFQLTDVKDTSVYMSAQAFTGNAMNPCQESTYTFLQYVMRSLKIMHSDIQPLTLYHFGGDEVPKGAWVNSSVCANSRLQLDVNDMEKWKEYFLLRLSMMAEAEGLELGAWEDGLINQKTQIPFEKSQLGPSTKNVYSYPWSNTWEYQRGDRAYRLANAGYKVIMSHGTHLYFDHAHEPDPEEIGLYWATRFIDTHKAFSYMPEQLYWNADVTGLGDALTEEQICGSSKCLQLTKPENIIGMECHLWSELLRSRDITDHQMFPRVIAMAERAWHEAPWETEVNAKERQSKMNADWLRFANTLGYKEFPYLDSLGVKYRISPPGAVVRDRKLLVNSGAPGLEIQYSQDFGKTWRDARGGPDLLGDSTVFIRTMSTDKKRWSRVVKLHYNHDQVSVKQRFADGQVKQYGAHQGPSQQQPEQNDNQALSQNQLGQNVNQGLSQKQLEQNVNEGLSQQQPEQNDNQGLSQNQLGQNVNQGLSQKQLEQNVNQGPSQQQPEQNDNKGLSQNQLGQNVNQGLSQKQLEQNVNEGLSQQQPEQNDNKGPSQQQLERNINHGSSQQHLRQTVNEGIRFGENENRGQMQKQFAQNVNQVQSRQQLEQNVNQGLSQQQLEQNVNQGPSQQQLEQNVNQGLSQQQLEQNVNKGSSQQQLEQNVNQGLSQQHLRQTVNEEISQQQHEQNVNKGSSQKQLEQNVNQGLSQQHPRQTVNEEISQQQHEQNVNKGSSQKQLRQDVNQGLSQQHIRQTVNEEISQQQHEQNVNKGSSQKQLRQNVNQGLSQQFLGENSNQGQELAQNVKQGLPHDQQELGQIINKVPSQQQLGQNVNPGPSQKQLEQNGIEGQSQQNLQNMLQGLDLGSSRQQFGQNVNPGPSQQQFGQNVNPRPSRQQFGQNVNLGPSRQQFGQNVNPGPSQKQLEQNGIEGQSQQNLQNMQQGLDQGQSQKRLTQNFNRRQFQKKENDNQGPFEKDLQQKFLHGKHHKRLAQHKETHSNGDDVHRESAQQEIGHRIQQPNIPRDNF